MIQSEVSKTDSDLNNAFHPGVTVTASSFEELGKEEEPRTCWWPKKTLIGMWIVAIMPVFFEHARCDLIYRIKISTEPHFQTLYAGNDSEHQPAAHKNRENEAALQSKASELEAKNNQLEV